MNDRSIYPPFSRLTMNTIYIVIGLLFCSVLSAKGQSARIEGEVRLSTGESLPGASIYLENTATGAITDASGKYRISGLFAGEYVIVAQFMGYETVRRLVVIPEEGRIEQDFELGQKTLDLEGVVVTGSRRAVELQDVPASLSVVPVQQIEQRAHIYASEPLVGVPGVVVKDNGESVFTTARFRGVPNNHQNDNFIALVDGIPFVSGGDEVNLDALVPLSVVERVEVVKGPTSALYGRGSIGGTVNYITKNAFGAPRVEAHVGAGSYGYFRPSLTASIPIAPGKNQLLINAQYEGKNGWRDGSNREGLSFFIKDQWLLSSRTNMTFYVNYYDLEQQYASHLPVRPDGSLIDLPGGETANYQIENTRDERQFFLSTLKIDHDLSANLNISGSAHYRFTDVLDFLGFDELFNEDTQEFYWNGFDAPTKSRTYFFEPQLTYTFNRGRVIAGASYEFIDTPEDKSFWTGEFGFNENTFEFLFYTQKIDASSGEFTNRDAWVTDQLLDSEYESSIFGAYTQVELDLTSRIGLTVGGRFDDFSRTSTYFTTTEEEETQTVKDDNRRFSPKASLRYKITPELSSYFTYAQGFSPAFGPNWSFESRSTGLKPEIGHNYEVGLKGRLLDNNVAFNLAAYRLVRQDLLLIIFPEGGGDTPRSTNAGEQCSQGIELEFQANLGRLAKGLSVFSNYAYTDSEWVDFRFVPAFETEEVDASGLKVSVVPEHMLQAGLNQQIGQVNAGLWLTYTSDYYVDRMNTVKTGGYTVLNASLSYPFPVEGLHLTVTGLNLLDQDYYHYFGNIEGARIAYPGRPLEIIAALRYQF